MAVILPFLRSSGLGDWSLAERARLSRLAERLAPEAGAVDVMFGASDTGEPWCVVVDPDGEVLIHVARIGGRFVVHDAAADVLQEGADLWSLLLQALRAPEPEPASAEIVSFPLPSRHAQTLIALITAAAFLRETELLAYVADPARDSDQGSAPQETPGSAERPAESGEAAPTPGSPKPRGEAVHLADAPDRIVAPALHLSSTIDLAEAVEAPAQSPSPGPQLALPVRAAPPAPTVEPSRTEAPPPIIRLLVGTNGEDRLQGTAAAETLLGGDGDDTLDGGGAPQDARDRLVGGGGADTLVLAARAIAEGGPGADRFMLPATGGTAGVVLDFRLEEADRFVTAEGAAARPLTADPVDDVLFDFRSVLAFELPAEPLPGLRLTFDADADGVVDTTVLVAGFTLDRPPPADEPQPTPATPLMEVFPGWPG